MTRTHLYSIEFTGLSQQAGLVILHSVSSHQKGVITWIWVGSEQTTLPVIANEIAGNSILYSAMLFKNKVDCC